MRRTIRLARAFDNPVHQLTYAIQRTVHLPVSNNQGLAHYLLVLTASLCICLFGNGIR